MEFKYHNIELLDGTQTIPGRKLYKFEEEPAHTLNWLYNKFPIREERKNISILDLGALEGGYAVALAQAGFKVTIVEARKDNYDHCVWIAKQLKLNINLYHMDAKDIDPSFSFDVVLCLGILYHLDKPIEFLNKISKNAIKFMIINTHYSKRVDQIYDRHPWHVRIDRFIFKRLPKLYKKYHYNLSHLDYNEGKPGRWYKEYNKRSSIKTIEKSREAAFSNARSFWLTSEALMPSIINAGFNKASTIYNKIGHDRKIIVCEK
jgi:hypothetical protein